MSRSGAALCSEVHSVSGGDAGPHSFLVTDEKMLAVRELVRRAARAPTNVLILGETGVGKDVVAHAIHGMSPRSDRVFLRIDCAALSDSLLEGELFGHERGSYTGAVMGNVGLLESAPGGTIFLDEIAELPLRLQAKLLSAIETKQLFRVGGRKPQGFDVRFVAATNRDLNEAVASGAFRRDLYFRLNGFPVHVPPLRERPADIARLARWFASLSARRLGRAHEPTWSNAAIACLERHRWPGNVRELRNVVEVALLMCDGPEIQPMHLGMLEPCEPREPCDRPFTIPPRSLRLAPPLGAAPPGEEAARASVVHERSRIEDALAACGGNQSRAARLLGIARSTLTLRLDAYGIVRPRKNRLEAAS